MTLPLLPLIDGCLFIDNSTLELLTTCPRAMQYSYLNKRILNADRSALSFGEGIHKALEYRYHVAPNASDLTLEQRLTMTNILGAHFAEKPTPLDDHRTLELALNIMNEYNGRTLVEEFKVLANDKNEPLVEMPFSVHLQNFYRNDAGWWEPITLKQSEQIEDKSRIIVVYYIGRIDLVVERQSRIWPVDHKTTSMMGPTWADEMAMSPQTEGYAWAIKKVTGQEPPGCGINGIRVRRPAKTKRAVEEEDFQRLWNYYEPGRLVEWERNTIALVEEFLWHHSRSFMPQKKKWCVGKYGRCQYYDICSLPPDQRTRMLASNIYTDNTWSPLKKENH